MMATADQFAEDKPLRGKVALVTGGASGAGRASAERLAELGAAVAVVDVDPAGDAVAGSINGMFLRFDVGDLEAWFKGVDQVARHWGGLDIVHLNAGVMTRPPGARADDDPLSVMSGDSYRRLVRVNIDGVVFGTLATVPALEARGGGHILVTSSASGLEPMPIDPFYGLSKHATVGFARSMGSLLVQRGIIIQALCPLGIDTPMVSPDLRIPGRTFAPPSDIAGAVVQAMGEGSGGDVWVAGPPGAPYRKHGFAPAR